MEQTKFVTVYMRVERISPDPVQYKPYNPVLEPIVTEPIYVRLMVPAASVVSGMDMQEPDGIIVTPKGLAHMCADVAAGIRDRYDQS
jgi:hypothetical protein